jgi:Icc protein
MPRDATVRVLQLTDPHLFADPSASLRGAVTYRTLERVLSHIRQAAWPADLVAVTGDLIQDDSAAAYDNFCDLLDAVGLPVHTVPGNHDVRNLMRSVLRRPGFHYCDSAVFGNWRIVGVDTCVSGSAGGRIASRELARLRQLLDNNVANNVLLCLHHPPVPLGSRWLDEVGLANADAFLDLVAGYNAAKCIMFGHAHQAFDGRHAHIRILGTPSTCRQFKPGSDEFALDTLPPAYRRVCLLADGGVETQLQWLHDDSDGI